jgi:3-hydroxybutyrate dehydrogenase
MTAAVESTLSATQLLAGKHALVTGGSRGIGAAITRVLITHGARVTITGRDEKRLARAAHDFGAEFVVGDVSDQGMVQRAFESAANSLGRIDILVNNAGQVTSAPFLKTNAELWRTMLTVNLDGTFYFTQAALPGMLEAGWGRVVNVASTAGLAGYA